LIANLQIPAIGIEHVEALEVLAHHVRAGFKPRRSSSVLTLSVSHGSNCPAAIPSTPNRAIITANGASARRSIEGDLMAATTGTIKRLVSDKGFGFVAAQDGSEYFFHQSACVDTRFDELREGQTVTFDKGQGPKGPRAENVRPA
jgi:CspA family cold shock protein